MNEFGKQWEGQALGEFYLREYLGGSDHSAVFLTEAAPQQAKAAIKLIPEDPATSELQLSRWNLAAKLSHPHLLRILQTGRCQVARTPLLYVVMDCADENLSQLLPHRPLTPTEAREMLRPVLNALAYIHAQGFVHGSLKPANVMAKDERIQISSDSLYHLDEWGGRLTKPSFYDPPEAASGGILPAGDVWSLGVMLVEALTQHLPEWKSAEETDPVLPETLPEPFRGIARQCLRRDPQRRPAVAEIAPQLDPKAEPVRVTNVAPLAAHVAAPTAVSAAKPAAPPARVPPPPAPAPATAPARVPAAAVKKTPPLPSPATALQKSQGKIRPMDPRHIVAAIVVSLVLVAAFAGAKLFSRRGELQRPTPVAEDRPPAQASAPPKAATKSSRRAAAPERASQQFTKKTANEKPHPVSATPAPAVLKSETPVEGLVRGEVLDQVLPEVSEKARATIRGTVRVSVKVRVDTLGNVAGADFDSRGPSNFFAEQALAAARRWEFAPAKVNGQYVPSEWILRFEFTRGGTKVFPGEVAP